MSTRTKRKTVERPNQALAQLKASRAAREAGTSRIHQYEAKDAEDVYDVVEDERVNKRLRQDHDDFVEDDDGQGYAYGDDYEDEYDDQYSEDEAQSKGSKKNGKGKSVPKGGPKPKAHENIRDAFLRGGDRHKPVKSTVSKQTTDSDDSYMASILSGLDNSDDITPVMPVTPVKKPFSSDKKVTVPTPTRALVSKMAQTLRIKDEDVDAPRDLSLNIDSFDYDDGFDDDVVGGTPPPEERRNELKKEIKQETDISNPFLVRDDDMSVEETNILNNTIKKEKASVVKQPENDTRLNWMAVDNSLNQALMTPKVESEATMDLQDTNIKEEDGTVRMYWIDACEVRGVVYIFGKVLQKASNNYISCCVAVQNMERNLFVLPRDKRVDGQGNETDIEVDLADVYSEFDKILLANRITSWQSKPVERKYAFDLPGIPSSANYLKAVYKYSLPNLPADLKGETFSHVFGTNTSALEHFIIKRNLMGPAWLEIKHAKMSTSKFSWCKCELSVTDAKNVTPLLELANLPPPPLCVMSLSLRTVLNPKDKSNEVVAATVSVYHEVRVDDPVENNKKIISKKIFVRKLDSIPFPPMFDDKIKKSRVEIVKLMSERMLLNNLLAHIRNTDPDVVVGHNFVGFDLDVLLHRLKHTKIDQWSSIGRLRRTVMPKLQAGAGGMGDTTAQEKNIMSGRLMCDTYLGAKEHLRAKSYSLTSLAGIQLNINREDVDYEKIPSKFSSAESLELMLQHADFDTYLCAELMFSMQLLPLSRQLTTLSGNLWSMTLTAGRAVRNEYLLLHEFHRNKYICPDKSFYKDNKDVPMAEGMDLDEEEAAAPKKGARRKPQYSGGLVLEPKKGFYDHFVLLLDFNSLYPSIIQEYNICFTTVRQDKDKDKDKDDDALPDYPEEGLPQGILPKLLANLVERRREVKKLMKNATGAKYEEYDIRQKGLKLTANSMYGCLGAAYSRFYAKPLAMLITSRGREILQSTVDLAIENGLDVIYGDTDSIMINTNTRKVEEVKPIAEGLKKIVNARYKLLEIEMDGMFQRMLLLKKKKYAALVVVEKNGKYEVIQETKGLDMVRRDWCALSHDVSEHILKLILSSDEQDREQVVESIHNYLRKVGEETRAGLINPEKFIINKGLTKAPEDYADAKSQPHVQVALRRRSKGISVRAGDTVPYIICTYKDSTTSKGSIAERAYHPEELNQSGSNLVIDFEYYLNQQVHPPVERLCGPIEGTDATRLADCLGLDTSKFRSATYSGSRDDVLQTLASKLSDEERFKNAEPLELRCRNCQTTFSCSSLLMDKVSDEDEGRFGLECPNCKEILQSASASVQLTVAIRKYIQRYYQGWVVCDEQSCRNRTRMVGVAGRRCLVEGCRGDMQKEYSDASLYTQLSYFNHIFDTSKLTKMKLGKVRVQAEGNRQLIEAMKTCADKYMKRNGRDEVDLGQLFSFVTI
ncbi:DNA-directed DNA polymerase alpha catalytic subunit pol1 [Mortierella sp. NVP85]|nr:DNA-directed DNA polymerase alpha catalytic subunit pol1 [Mortierella sp. NVP85]